MLITDKAELRRLYKSKRASLINRDDLSAKIISGLTESDVYKKANMILCYVSFGDEVDTYRLITQSFDDGKIIAVPYCTGKRMEFRIINSLDNLTSGKFGIMTADDTCPVLEKSDDALCIVPALSIDKNFNRLGYGGGFYDRFLSANSGVISIGICYDDCVADFLPTEKTDIPLDGYITENGCFGGVFDGR